MDTLDYLIICMRAVDSHHFKLNIDCCHFYCAFLPLSVLTVDEGFSGFYCEENARKWQIVSVTRSDFPSFHYNPRQISLSLSSVNGNGEERAVWGL